MKKYVVFNQKVAGFLMVKGFVLKKIEKSHENSHMNVFIFNDTRELRNKISEYDSFVQFLREHSEA